MLRGNLQLMKSVNKSIILNKIRQEQPISRAEIAKQTKLTRPTVSTIVKELINEKLVTESVLGESQGGRKPTMLLIKKDSFYIIGIDAGPRSIKGVLCNLAGEQLHHIMESYQHPITNESFLSLLIATIQPLIDKISTKGKVIGIGVAMHGVVNVETGTSLFAPLLDLKDIPIMEVLEHTFALPVKVENDARAMALGESWFGAYGQQASMLAVNFGNGVGAGFILNDDLYHGPDSLAGEVGHMVIDIHGERCACGSYGCLQTFASAPSIVRRANSEIDGYVFTSSKEVYELALQGNEACRTFLERTGEIIGIGLTNLLHIINPEILILGGGVMKAERFMLPAIHNIIQNRSLTPSGKNATIVISELGDSAARLGAVALILAEVFDPVLKV